MDTSPLQFDIAPSSGVPIYRQIVDQVVALVAGGRLTPGDFLPSVRQVAQTADVNPMTVSKAYGLLESDGVVERIRGQGMCVSATATSGPLAERREQAQQLLAPAIHRARLLGLTDKQIRALFEASLKDSAK
ncbi:GntR family transcriptional regulator [Aeoliella sp. ICT_H6.2]|uniref:GntR family transcriptional regulator n=1 Tax=Aeoliella straminimaris TaxID=2954799 RepID=A0A9X2F7K6_9BACT|nr:GntR family transcriptional regulator [Aeoliella straminimaris]MCO6043790.1 GntR family transcriptional regulator [Aeoliella straminimaris]